MNGAGAGTWPHSPGDDASSHPLRQAIGYIGFLLPIFLWILAGWRSVRGYPGWRTLDAGLPPAA